MVSKCVPLTPFQGSCLDPPHEGGTSLARGLSCIKMNKSTFCLYREKILKVHNSNVLEKNPLLICLAGIFCIFSRWIMFRHSSDLIVCCPVVLTLRQCGLLVASVPPVCQCALGTPQLAASFLTRSKLSPAGKLPCDYPGFWNPHHTKFLLKGSQELWLSWAAFFFFLVPDPKSWLSAHPKNSSVCEHIHIQDLCEQKRLSASSRLWTWCTNIFFNWFTQVKQLLCISLVSWCVQPSHWLRPAFRLFLKWCVTKCVVLSPYSDCR